MSKACADNTQGVGLGSSGNVWGWGVVEVY